MPFVPSRPFRLTDLQIGLMVRCRSITGFGTSLVGAIWRRAPAEAPVLGRQFVSRTEIVTLDERGTRDVYVTLCRPYASVTPTGGFVQSFEKYEVPVDSLLRTFDTIMTSESGYSDEGIPQVSTTESWIDRIDSRTDGGPYLRDPSIPVAGVLKLLKQMKPSAVLREIPALTPADILSCRAWDDVVNGNRDA